MPASTTTGDNLLIGLSKFVDDYFASTTTSAGASGGTTIVDTALEIFGDNRLVGWYVRTGVQVSRVTANAQATGTVTVAPPFSAQIAGSTAYALHRYEPRKKFMALDAARLPVAEYVYKLIYDETLTTDGLAREYDIPSTIQRGPALVFLENPMMSSVANWNFLPASQCDDTMVNWTASSATLTSHTRSQTDRLIPKYGTACTKIAVATATNGTVTLPVASMINGVTAATAAGRAVTYCHWIYCKLSGRVTLKLLTDAGTLATSAAHQGRGWEFLSVSGTVAAGNATTLSCRIDVSNAAGAVTFYANNTYFYYGDFGTVMSNYYDSVPLRIRRDATTQRFITNDVLPERRQLRLVGKGLLTALGTDTTAQTTATMEVDEPTAEILYAEAAEILFQLERITAQSQPQIVERIRMVRDRAANLRMLWEYEMPEQRFISPFMR